MLEQYFGMKAKHPEAVLLSRVGDFYEAYGEDAETVARALQIALTSKEAGSGQRIAMAGVPHHALAQYMAKLVAQRFVVALAEQLEVPQPNRLVRRDVVRLITPGTLFEEQLLEGGRNNYLAAVSSFENAYALTYADISTGSCSATALSGADTYDDLLAELHRIAPAEVVADVPSDLRTVLSADLEATGARVTQPPIGAAAPASGNAVDGFSRDESIAMRRSLDVLNAFLRRTGIANHERSQGADGSGLRPPVFYRLRSFLELDASTRKHLELMRSIGQNPRATLCATLDRCATAMGSRMLGRWIVAPLIDPDAIEARQDAVASLIDEHARRATLRELLKGCFDLERIAQKVRLGRAGPRDLGSLRRTIECLGPIRDSAPAALAPVCDRVADFGELLDDLRRTLADDLPAQIADGGAVRPESDTELAECVALRGDARGQLAQLEERERERTGIKSLKVRYASAYGYALEVGNAHVASVPERYVRKQTLTNAERYTTPELKELEVAIATAQTRQERLEQRLFDELCGRIATRIDELLDAADAIAEIDAFASLALCAAERGYVRPQFDAESAIAIEAGRHPVMEAILHAQFVANDCTLRPGDQRFILLTGPNMGGKSTYLRQTGLLTIMAQIGSFVPAASMRLGIVDRIFTRIGAGDDLASGQSTFYMEMAEAANILRRSTDRSLLLIDEVGRGTGTLDGLSIAQAICEFLLALDSRAPMVLFATHFHELCALADHWNAVANYHITAVENMSRGGAPVFSHRVAAGSSSRSFGIEVARMAGLPASVVERAREISEALAGQDDVETQAPLRRTTARALPVEQQLALLYPS
jgi:DNA mismatch repair protein MutS